MTDEYIRREDAIEVINQGRLTKLIEADVVESGLKNLPAADVAPVVHSRWIEVEGEGYNGIHCSRCRFPIPYGNVMMGYNFCPKCGAIMDARGEE